MTDTTQLNSHSALVDITARYEALLRDFGLLKQLEALRAETLTCDQVCSRVAGLITLEGIAEYCSIMLLDATASYLELRAVATRYSSEGFAVGTDMWNGKRFAVGEGIAGRVAATGTHIRIVDTQADPDYLSLPDSPIRTRSLMCFPLADQGTLLGVLNLSHGRPAFFDIDREHAMALTAQRVARILGHALRNEPERVPEGQPEAPDSAPDEVLLVFDRDGNVLRISDHCAALTGLPASTWTGGGVDWRSHIAPGDLGAYDAYYAALENGRAGEGVTYTFATGSGAGRRFRESALPFPASAGSAGGFVALVQDDVKRATRRRWSSGQSVSKLLHAQRIQTMGQLAGGIVHDMNNILTAIVGNLDLALAADPHGKSRELVAQARSASIRGAEIVHKVLNFSRAGAGEGTHEPLQAAHLLREAAGILRCSLDAHIHLEVAAPEGRHGVRGDAGELLQVLIILGVNARDALEQRGMNGPNATWQMKMGLEPVHFDPDPAGLWGDARRGDYVRFYVYDNGIGMAPDVLARLYEPFYSTKPAGKGAGLGLATAHRIVGNHHGWLDVHSTPGAGTTFSIYLPACPREAAESPAPAPEAQSDAPEQILLVDDEPLVRKLGAAILKRLGYRALTASTGREALEAYEQHAGQIDLVILDLQLPDIGGEKVFQALRDVAPDLPIIYSSGMSDSDFAHLPDAVKPTAFLQKPYLIATMAEVIREALPRHD